MKRCTPCLRRIAGLIGCALPVALVAASAQAAEDDGKGLTIVSWGGVYQKSQREAYFKPFTEKTGIQITEDTYPGDFDQVIEQVESGDVRWDVVDVTLSDAIRGCENGHLEPIPPTILQPAPDGTPAMEDFLKNTLHECAVGQILWSTVWAYDRNAFDDEVPETVEDVWDVERFPGERGMRKTPHNNLEWALMADGVAPEEVYAELRTEEGVDRAFAQLDRLRDNIRWWEDGAKPQEWLASGEVPITTAYNGRIFNSIVKQEQPFGYIWDGQMWDIDLWVIPRGADNLAQALEFISFATATKPLAEQTEYVAYAPARKSSLPLIRREYMSHMPTAPSNFRNALQRNFIWWSENKQDMDERFDAWLGEE